MRKLILPTKITEKWRQEFMTLTAKERVREARRKHQIPAEISQNPELLKALSLLPDNYNFEVAKTIWHIKQNDCRRVALQFPEGLILFSITLADIIERLADVETVIMGDVSYGACCIDDFTSSIFGCDMIIHYGHSCLVPLDMTPFSKVLYVFVEIRIDVDHFVSTIAKNFRNDSYFACITTIQFATDLHNCVAKLKEYGFQAMIPQAFPLSKGEVLGCTAPALPDDITEILYLGDGRFHIESLMIQSPHIPAYKYDPYNKMITKEVLDHEKLMDKQETLINKAMHCTGRFGIVLGTLGRQGNTSVFNHLKKQIVHSNRASPLTILVSELTPQKLLCFEDKIDVWVQIACPRLSIDWSDSFHKPLLTTYELSVVTGNVGWNRKYPMDYYAADSLGPWTPNHNVMATSKLRKRAPKTRKNSLTSTVSYNENNE